MLIILIINKTGNVYKGFAVGFVLSAGLQGGIYKAIFDLYGAKGTRYML